MHMQRSFRRRVAPPLVPPMVAALVLAGCMPAGPYLRRTPGGYERVAPEPGGSFGYVSAGFIARADFHGEVNGLEPGTGSTITLPLGPGILAVAVVAVMVVAVAAAADGGGDLDLSGLDMGGPEGGMWDSGFSAPQRKVLSEFSRDFTFSSTHHRDRDFGGALDYSAFLLGVRLGGPRRYSPRYYFTGGWGWYGVDYDNRADASVHGPYIGGGLELFANPGATVGVDYKAHYFIGDDDAGVLVDGFAGQLALVLTGYW